MKYLKAISKVLWAILKFLLALAGLIIAALLILWLWWVGLVLIWLHLPNWCLLVYNLTWLAVWLLALLKA